MLDWNLFLCNFRTFYWVGFASRLFRYCFNVEGEIWIYEFYGFQNWISFFLFKVIHLRTVWIEMNRLICNGLIKCDYCLKISTGFWLLESFHFTQIFWLRPGQFNSQKNEIIIQNNMNLKWMMNFFCLKIEYIESVLYFLSLKLIYVDYDFPAVQIERIIVLSHR